MGVIFTAEAEKRRQEAMQKMRAKKAVSWELLKTQSLVEALQYAKKSGWKDGKVQVKAYRIDEESFEYAVEPFEEDCRCPNLLRYEDYFE
jgi:hypothetical protein